MMATLVGHFGCLDTLYFQVEDNIWLLRSVISTNSTFRTLIDPFWPLEGSEVAGFGVDRGWLILDATLIKIRLLGYFRSTT